MKSIYSLLLLLFLVQSGHAQRNAWIIPPSMEVPDSLAGGVDASVSLLYFVNFDGKIVGWQLSSILHWNRKKRVSETLYQDNLIRYFGNAQTGKYEPRIVEDFKVKNSPAGMQLVKRLTPWLEEYVKQTKFYIADSTAFQRGQWRGRTVVYGSIIPLRGGKQGSKGIQTYLKREKSASYRPARKDSKVTQKESPLLDYFEPEPKLIYKPIIATPDSLKAEKLPVKVIAIVKIDTTGAMHFDRILYSSNQRFNGAATNYALQYRFKVDSAKTATRYIRIPMSFTK